MSLVGVGVVGLDTNPLAACASVAASTSTFFVVIAHGGRRTDEVGCKFGDKLVI